MNFLTRLLQLFLLLTAITLVYEIGAELLIHYYQLEVTQEVPNLEGFLQHAKQTLVASLHNLVELNWGELKFVSLLVWLYLYHLYYILIFFLFLIVFYEYRLKTMPKPNVIAPTTITADTYEAHKKTETAVQLEKLKNSQDFKALQDKKFAFVINEDEDSVAKQLQEKESEIFN